MTIDLETYAGEAEAFVSALDHEYYLHFAGHKEAFEIEQIYARHASLFERSVVEALRERLEQLHDDGERRCRYLLQLAVEGFIGQATKRQSAALAEREAALEIEVDGRREPYRQAAIVQSNEPDPDRRALLERARLDALESELNPLHKEVLEQSHGLAVELGWPSYRRMYEDLKALDLEELGRQTRSFLEATSGRYREIVEPQLEAETGTGFDGLRSSDLPYFFRAVTYDPMFPAAELTDVFDRTLAGLGIELEAQENVILDLEQRPRKSPRAFCAPVRVPDEIYLVIPRRGGRDDYAALFHEGGHTEHYASVERELPFEFRCLGDNSVTEGFAFLFDHLVEDETWLRALLGRSDAARYLEYCRASELLFLRRYVAKLDYELELHAGRRPLSEMPERYARGIGEAIGVQWPAVSYLSDVDEGYYVANYLRAWAFEAQLRHHLRERFGPAWFERPEAGEMLRSVWRQGQRLNADELLAEITGEPIDFSVMVEEVLP